MHLPNSMQSGPIPRPRALVRLHWLTLLVVILGLGAIWWRDAVDDQAIRHTLMYLHSQAGFAVWLLTAARLALRAKQGVLPNHSVGPAWQRPLVGWAHAALYLMLLTQPILGWALSSAQNHTLEIVGLPLPALMPADEDLADTLWEWHERLAWTFIALIVMHTCAALWHHWVLKDEVLKAMRPR